MDCPAFTKKKAFRVLVALAFLVLMSSIIFGWYQFNKKHARLERVEPEFVITATELYSAFESDEAAANAIYTGRVIEVTGSITRVETSSEDHSLTVILGSDDPFSGVICTFPGSKVIQSDRLVPGSQLTIRGECSGMLMDVLLNNCVLIDNGE